MNVVVPLVSPILLGDSSLFSLSWYHFPSVRPSTILLLEALPPPLSQSLLLHVGLLTTGHSAPFPPLAHHTFGLTAEGTSTHLGMAKDRAGKNNRGGWHSGRDWQPTEVRKSREQKWKPGDEGSWGNEDLSVGMGHSKAWATESG